MKSLLFLSTCCLAILFCLYGAPAQQSQSLQERGLYFIKNNGQVIDSDGEKRSQIEYTAESGAMKLYFTKQGVSYVFIEKKERKLKANRSQEKKNDEVKVRTQRVDMQLLGSNANAELVGEEQAYTCNYYVPQCPGGLTGIPAYTRLVYKNIYNNIDLVFYTYAKGVKYDFIVRPGGQVSDIRFKYSGANDVSLTSEGKLRVTSQLGELKEHKPVSYKKGNNGRSEVESSFSMENGEVSFIVGDFAPTDTLVLDPEINWSTYLGGSGDDGACDNIAVDSQGNIIIRGETTSINFPVSTNASQTVYGGVSDAFIIKMTPTGRRLWATYFGGTQYDSERKLGGVAVDNNDNIIITGSTQSDSSSFPETSGAFQVVKSTGTDAYVAKFSSTGTLTWATYYGGNSTDYGFGITTDSQGNILICGETLSSDFPVSTGAFQTSKAGATYSDGFIAKFNSSGQRVWGTYFGGTGSHHENMFDIAVDNNDEVVVVGMVANNFPITTTGMFQTTHGGGIWDGLIAKFSTSGTRQWATYMGGSLLDEPNKVATDSENNIVVIGAIESTNFPVTSTTAIQSAHGGGSWDGFLAKFSGTGQRLWSSYYGGSLPDAVHGVAVDASDNIYISGYTESTNLTVTADAIQATLSGPSDAFVMKLDEDGRQMWCTYLGGSDDEAGTAIGLDRTRGIVLAGYTQSTNLTVTATALQSQYGGGSNDAFIIRLVSCNSSDPIIEPRLPITYCTTDSSVILDAGEFASYLWSNGATSRHIVVTQDGSYWVTVWNERGCPATSTVYAVDVP